MENRSVKSSEEAYEVATEELDAEDIDDYEIAPSFNAPLVSQKLQDFYDLLALQNQHPEFTNEVVKQLKSYTNDNINSFKVNEAIIINNIKQLGEMIRVNDSTQKIKLEYSKMVNNLITVDTIYAILTTKAIMIDNETLVSNKVHFSKD
ncbi:hypothetical protein WPG_0608 [Winogradskyella sp. PG-2]|nr:hypothetical protein WPG_0608 [Winogradskyella sp. PG-2]